MPTNGKNETSKDETKKTEEPKEERIQTKHSVVIDGQSIAYTATLNDYVRRELRFESDLPYEILTGLYLKWDYSKHQNQYLNVAETLRKTMSQNPYLKIFVANGYYDLATPYFATEYTFNHLEIEPSLQQNITMAWYEAGHMMYVHPPSLVQIKADMAAFIEAATDADAKEPLGVLPVW